MISSNSVSSFYPKRAGKPPKKAPAVPKKTGLSKLPRAIVALLANSVGADSTSPVTGVQTTMFPDAAKDGFVVTWSKLDGSISLRRFTPDGVGGFIQGPVLGVTPREVDPVQFPAHLLSGQISPDVLPDQIPVDNLPPIPPEKLTTVPADKLRGTVPIEAMPMITDDKLVGISADKIIGVFPVDSIPPIPGDKLTVLLVDKLQGSIPVHNIPIIQDEKLAGVSANKITGVLSSDTIPPIVDNKIVNVSTSKLVDQVSVDNLPPIPPEKLTTVPADKLRGTVPIEAIPMITDEKLTSIAADKINGTLPAQALSAASLYHNPIGSVIHYPTNIVPTDYLECNGQTVRRDQYPELFNVISVTYGPGDSVTTFKLPDYRGQFLRGWDHGSGNDPDRYSRTNRGDGRSGDYVGTRQDDEFKLHNHDNGIYDRLLAFKGFNTAMSTDAAYTHDEPALWDSKVIKPQGGSETRPKNIAVMFIIRAK